MLKSLWLWSTLAVIMQWIWASAYSTLIDAPRINGTSYLLMALVAALTLYRWSKAWKRRQEIRSTPGSPIAAGAIA
jgi:hypothetical protein